MAEPVLMTSYDLALTVKGSLTGPSDLPVDDITTDSRILSYTERLAFIAIKGRNHDGHQFVDSLYGKGVRVFIMERLPAANETYKNAAFIIVENSVTALQDMAAFKRKRFLSPVVAVTGSAGKTVVKEWLAEITGLSMPVIRSPRSYNSQIGVPLSVWKLDNTYKLGIFEAGISQPGEMEKLRRIIDPDTGIITNIGLAHSENFIDDEEKASEKLKLFLNCKTIVYCRDNELIDRLIRSDVTYSSKNLVDWSFSNREAAIFADRISVEGGSTTVEMTCKGSKMSFLIPFTDRASVENAVTAASACIALQTDPEIIRKGLAGLVSVAMRMDMKTGINNCILIEDYYNSDPGSLVMALEFLRSQNGRKRTLILSDFLESSRDQKELYWGVAEEVRKSGIDRFIGIGPGMTDHSSFFGPEATFFYSTGEFIHQFNPSSFSNETILIKGARKFEFENIVKLLELQVHQTILEVNLDAIAHNLNEIRGYLDPGTRIMAMVKAFAYGAGPSEIANLLEYHRVSCLGVAYADEGAELRNAGVTLPVMVMNPDPGSSDIIIRHGLEPELYSMTSFRQFAQAASRHGLVHYPVHIKIDTGMHRLGFMPHEIEDLASELRTAGSLKVASVFSHFAASEDPAFDHFTHRQAELFLKAVTVIREAAGYPFLRHICNTAAIVRFPQYHFDMVRPGIGIYGACRYSGLNLRPVNRFRTRISQIKRIAPGEPVGYGCNDISDKERLVAIVPVGYADGLSRKLGNRNGFLLVRNTRVPIIGNICMDMCMIDVTGVKAEEGDETEIFGENILISELAERCGTIPYEILTSVSPRVKRIFFRE
ncbi:MAG TPA: bifunctional UDP-N-acetylmuramoyl-tripeptide:D-alanyl-D-alanine ligase/alanine racemase [Bacteroidales bacterium]|nr:bifunctional UDP-N-acetylmuramoyl-tripeptide:D-alanyl-D-alanine ligase/alanine racemase [Bacteroidales bacterium]HPF03324.1 bifunctional UDP-N-acetylmuramoyl-tripeptide:D-alanyl-D-alanine ligase/alanine racemase [Bacteroidales bacterium]HPJ59805.1 bifunctional UDP-N-acetylmuramoyl-tripeptide:D-alanyl-D-alanine ligase/alanine racemase [Bacteroidales bacterium]HRW85874.1 bifunctional UDP-N-acetylmuramoyl-tripeptide:D-alanyl-D-alanine ligase/alanine racemase [Bacteroidales bacterium]